MSITSRYLAPFFLMLFSTVGAMGLGGETLAAQTEYSVKWLGANARVEAMCGDFFGYDSIPGISDKRISFKYASGDKLFVRAVAYSNMRTEIDASKTEPTVEFVAQGDIVVRITQSHYEKEKDCLPPPKE